MHIASQIGAAPRTLRPQLVGPGLALAAAATAFIVIGSILAGADRAPDTGHDAVLRRAAVSNQIAAVESWAFGDVAPRYVATPGMVDAAAVPARIAELRTITDPRARAQAELRAWRAPLTVVAITEPDPIDAAQARARILALRAITDPIERAQAELSGWQVRWGAGSREPAERERPLPCNAAARMWRPTSHVSRPPSPYGELAAPAWSRLGGHLPNQGDAVGPDWCANARTEPVN